jgi:hypothetical protein
MPGPYDAGGNPDHPGVQGKPYDPANPLTGGKVDVPGTGTYPPHLQGKVGQAQPAGLSSSTNYGEASPGIVPGASGVTGPVTHPLPDSAEGEEAAGLSPQGREQFNQAKSVEKSVFDEEEDTDGEAEAEE